MATKVRRYERTENKQHRFWEISVIGNRTITVEGVVGKTAKTEKLTWYDATNAEAEAKRMIERQLRRAYAFVGTKKGELEKKSAVSKTKREGDLEARIREAPGDTARWLVYADWLSEQGDPRGELIVVQEARARKPKDRALARREDALLDKHNDVFVGEDLSALIDDMTMVWRPRYHEVPTLAVTWRNGFFEEATLRDRHEWDDLDETDDDESSYPVAEVRTCAERLTQILDHPSSLFLQSLNIVATGQRRYDYRSIVEVLATRKLPPPLTRLSIGDDTRPELCQLGDIGDLLKTYSNLSSLELRGRCKLVDEEGTFPKTLEHLVIEQAPDKGIIEAVKRSKLKRTARIDLGA